MDQVVVNWVFAGFSTVLGWLLKGLWEAIKDLKRDMRQIERDLPEVYVRKDAFRDAVSELKSDMRELRQDMKEGFNKIDNTLTFVFKRVDTKEDKE
jgi:hypothetical protein